MMNKHVLLIRILILGIALSFKGISYAQQNSPARDSVAVIDSASYRKIEKDLSQENTGDSSRYKALQSLSAKSKFTKFLYRIMIRPVVTETNSPEEKRVHDQDVILKKYKGRRIRKIDITTLDPFGYNIFDTSAVPARFLPKAGNDMHLKTRVSVIKGLLLFSENDRCNPYLLRESERLIRSQKYIRDVYLTVIPAPGDSVDVHIRVIDVWSIVPSVRITPVESGFGLNDLNFAGLGNMLSSNVWWKNEGGEAFSRMSYLMQNIRNTYINLNVQYLFSLNANLAEDLGFDRFFFSPVSYNPGYMFSANKNIIKSIEASRAFYSPEAKWAGGIFLGQMLTTQSYVWHDSLRYMSAFTNIRDLWLGNSMRLNTTFEGERINSLVLSGRLVRTRTPERTEEAVNENIFNTRNFYFAGINLTSRKYQRDRYIFNYGKTEDVPEGRMAGVTFGFEGGHNNRFYLGLSAGWGSFYEFGYLAAHLSYGTYKGASGFEQGTLSGRITYFTRLLDAGNWKIRQFITPSFIYGINRYGDINQPMHIGIKGFEKIQSTASNVTLISLQTQSYSPWNIAGFHFGPYVFAHLALEGKDPFSPRGSFYSLLGAGVLIRNDYLMFNTFQISLSFYPFIPGNGYNIFRANAYRTSDFGFRDFEVAKPGIIE